MAVDEVVMKVHLFNHWFKYKVPIDKHWERIESKIVDEFGYHHPWEWLNDKYDVGQYFNVHEMKNYMVFHNKEHYMMFLLKL